MAKKKPEKVDEHLQEAGHAGDEKGKQQQSKRPQLESKRRDKADGGKRERPKADGGRSSDEGSRRRPVLTRPAKPAIGYQGKCVLNPTGQPRHGKVLG
jgi:hypothetical protein